MITPLLLLLQSQSTSGTQWPSGWTIIAFVIGGVVTLIYLFYGSIEKISTGRKELLEVEAKKFENLQKEKDEADFQIKELKKTIEKLEDERTASEKDKVLLLREYHQILQVSISDLATLKQNAKIIEQLEEEVNKYREEKGLPPRKRSSNDREE